MSESAISIIRTEFEQKRRKAERLAFERKRQAYTNCPELFDIDVIMSDTATEYTRRMLGGEDVKAEFEAKMKQLADKKAKLYQQNGIDERTFEPDYECETCKDTGFTDSGMCNCFKNRVIELNFKNSNIGNTLEGQSFDKFRLDFYSDELVKGYPVAPRTNMERILRSCMRFADRFDESEKSLLFVGGTGLGKTFLSTCIARELLNSGKSVIYISAVDFFKRIEKSRFDSTDTDVKLFESCDLLIIDDLGTEAPSVYTTAVFSDILDKRIRLGKKMILSSNNTFAEFERLYGERVFSRLAGYFDCMMFYGKDIRIQKFLGKA